MCFPWRCGRCVSLSLPACAGVVSSLTSSARWSSSWVTHFLLSSLFLCSRVLSQRCPGRRVCVGQFVLCRLARFFNGVLRRRLRVGRSLFLAASRLLPRGRALRPLSTGPVAGPFAPGGLCVGIHLCRRPWVLFYFLVRWLQMWHPSMPSVDGRSKQISF